MALRHLPISFIEWTDDCKASKSNKKSKRGSIWVWTSTILSNANQQDSPEATCLIAIGYKEHDHNNIEQIIGNDFKMMASHRAKGFIGAHQLQAVEEVTFSVQTFLCLGDQPERRGGNSLMGGKA
jgi:hypothetical protein